MEETSRICPQCGQPTDNVNRCPNCGDTMLTWQGGRTLDMTGVSEQTPAWNSERPSEEEDSLIGRQFEHYRIESFLGRGGMARVYLAEHRRLERLCAVKILNPSVQTEEGDAVDSLLAEARAAAALTHPHVVTIHTLGEFDGQHFIDMEYVPGMPLSHFIRAYSPIDPIQAASVMVQISSALACAHELGMVHRDVKPGNVMFKHDGTAKLADFGLARRVTTGSTFTAGLTGTPNFMAPELFSGNHADQRSDIYAMGVTYYSMIAGELPFQGQTLKELMELHQDKLAPDVRSIREEVSAEAAAVIDRCLSKSPHDRFRDAAELHGELRSVYGSLRSLEDLIQEAFLKETLLIQGEGDRFTMTVPLPEQRTQKVFVELRRSSALHEQIIRIYSICAPVDEQYYEHALQLNAQIPHGAIGIDNIDGKPHFVMSNAYPRATCDPEEIRLSVLAIAAHADEIEYMLTGEDIH